MVGLKTPFGDEESDLLDRFERMWFEAHLNRAMQTRSLSLSSEPESAPTTQGKQPPPPRRRRSGPRFHRVLKKLINPILGINSKISNNGSIRRRQVQDPPPPPHPITLKVFSRSLHF
ncbi:hypothetical protein QN277_025078 [Acacia crassicarpa]|uniref:Uncharacterized protein n=1 Tax=Acacia crassicarpa TaxID=499986 RepID=A0AAE1KAH1_9FABA|nr:hypothetical protein QN277_025078 [Acacia crassicarpa]